MALSGVSMARIFGLLFCFIPVVFGYGQCSQDCWCSTAKIPILGDRDYYVLNCTATKGMVANSSLADSFTYSSDSLLDTNILQTFYSLKSLTLQGGIESLNAIPPISSLQILDVSQAFLSYIPDTALYRISANFHTVSLTYDNLEFLGDEAFKKQNSMKFLNLSHNVIDKIPEGLFYSFSELKTLDLSYNLLYSIKWSYFLGTNSLSELFLDFNHLTSLDNSDFPWSTLDLFIRNNFIYSISWTSNNKQNINTLDISGNSLSEMEEFMFANSVFSKLIISNMNKLKVIEADVFRNVTIDQLIISENPSLEYVHPLAINPYSHIKQIVLSHNKLHIIPKRLSTINGIGSITAVNNPLLCDCNMLWILMLHQNGSSIPLVTIEDNSAPLLCYAGSDLDDVTEESQSCAPQRVFTSRNRQTIDEGSSLTLKCKVGGIPKPEITWSYGGQPIPSDTNINVRDDVLTILRSKSDNSGQYLCTALNSEGTFQYTFNISVTKDTSQLFILSTGVDTVEVSWRISNPSNKYKAVLINVKNNTQKSILLQQFPRSRHSQSFTISGLHSDSTYRICLAFENQEEVDNDRCETVTTLSENQRPGRGITDYSLYGIITASVVSLLFICLIVCVCMTTKSYAARKRKKEMAGMVSESSYGLMTTSFSQRSHLSSMFDNPGATVHTPTGADLDLRASIMAQSPVSALPSSLSGYRLKRTVSDPLLPTTPQQPE